MNNTTHVTLLAGVSMTADERPRRTETTSHEVAPHPERSSQNSDSSRPDVQQVITYIRNTEAELNRIKEALRRLRIDNPNLTSEQLAAIKARVTQRARDLIANAKSISDQIEELQLSLNSLPRS